MRLSATQEAQLFAELVGLPEAEQTQRLQHLNLDPDSALALRQLLASDSSAETELEGAIAEEVRLWSHRAHLEAQQALGRFTILERLGGGGMGEVFLVSYEEAGSTRQAALKLLRPNFLRGEQMEFWERERKLAARLTHPYIATLLESGVLDTGEPYLLMEYVEGKRIDAHCAPLALAQRVRILAKVCAGVAAAHRQLIVHRDLKPANILVTPDGLPKILDFGIGQQLEDPTNPIAAASKHFASPEQLEGALPTTASDVYSLGALIAHITGNDATPDLNSIARKAREHNPEQRYASADALRQDLERWIEKRPVEAHPATWSYRLECLLRRQPGGMVLSSLALLLIGLALSFAAYEYQQSQTRFRELRKLAGVAIFDLDEAIRNLPGSLPARRMVLENALRYLESLEAAARQDRSLREELADAYQRVAGLQMSGSGSSLNQIDAAQENLRKALDVRDALGHAQSRDPKTTVQYASLLKSLASNARLRMKVPESEQYLARALAYSRQWTEREPQSKDAWEAFVYAGDEETRRLRRQGVPPALEHQRINVARVEQYHRLAGETPKAWKLRADQYRLLGMLEAGVKNEAGATSAFARAIESARQWYTAQPGTATIRTLAYCYDDAILTLVPFAPNTLPTTRQYLQDLETLLQPNQLPDPSAAFWTQHRIGLTIAKGHLAQAEGNLPQAKQILRTAADQLDAIMKTDEGKSWAAIARVRIATTLAFMDRPQR